MSQKCVLKSHYFGMPLINSGNEIVLLIQHFPESLHKLCTNWNLVLIQLGRLTIVYSWVNLCSGDFTLIFLLHRQEIKLCCIDINEIMVKVLENSSMGMTDFLESTTLRCTVVCLSSNMSSKNMLLCFFALHILSSQWNDGIHGNPTSRILLQY